MAKELGARTSLSVAVLERGGARKRGLRRRHGRARLQRALPHDAGLCAGDGHAALYGAGPRRSHSPARVVHAGTGHRRRGRTLGRGFSALSCPTFSSCSPSTTQSTARRSLPEDHAVVDWGITWNEIEPYYTRADKLVGASGKAGNIRGKLIEGGNPLRGRAARNIPRRRRSCRTSLRSSRTRRNRWAIIRIRIPRRP